MEVTDERTQDGEMLRSLVEGARKRVKVKKVYGYGGYESSENFKLLAEAEGK